MIKKIRRNKAFFYALGVAPFGVRRRCSYVIGAGASSSLRSAQRGGAYGLYNAAIGLTVLPVSLIAGLLWQGVGAWTGFGPSAPFFFGALMALLAGFLFSRLIK